MPPTRRPADPIINVFPQRLRKPIDFGDPFNFPPPQAKLPGSRRYRAERRPDILPTPFHFFPLAALNSPAALEPRPQRGFWLWTEIPRMKLRGLSPADSHILRTAARAGLIDPKRILLAPLVPWVAQHNLTRVLAYPGVPPRDVTPDVTAQATRAAIRIEVPEEPEEPEEPPDCPDAPMQPDAAIRGDGQIELLEVKPNAGYVALGQTLAYAWNWNRFFGTSWPARPAILTDLPRAYLPGMALDFGITLYTLGELLIEPPPWPT